MEVRDVTLEFGPYTVSLNCAGTKNDWSTIYTHDKLLKDNRQKRLFLLSLLRSFPCVHIVFGDILHSDFLLKSDFEYIQSTYHNYVVRFCDGFIEVTKKSYE